MAVFAAAAVMVVATDRSDDRVVEAAGGVCDDDCGAGGEFHEIVPERALDSRRSGLDVSPGGAKPTGPSNPTFDLEVTGVGGVPEFVDDDGDGFDDNVLAVAVTITAVRPTERGHVTAFGKGESRPEASVLNFRPGTNVANSAILRPGEDGKLTFAAYSQSSGRSHFVVDITGWFSTSAYGDNGARLLPVNNTRLYDSREVGDRRAVGAGGQIEVTIQDSSKYSDLGVDFDAEDVVGVLVNLTSVNRLPESALTYLSAQPDRVPSGKEPATSNLNIDRDRTRAATSIVPLGGDRTFYVYNRAGASHVIVDLLGVLVKDRPSDTRLGRVVPLTSAFRSFDSREPEFGAKPLGPGQAETWDYADFVADVEIDGEWVGNQAGMVGNLTALLSRQYPSVPALSHLTLYPTPSDVKDVPDTSNINLADGDVVPNMAMVRFGGSTGSERVSAFNSGGFLHYIYDVSAVILAD